MREFAEQKQLEYQRIEEERQKFFAENQRLEEERNRQEALLKQTRAEISAIYHEVCCRTRCFRVSKI